MASIILLKSIFLFFPKIEPPLIGSREFIIDPKVDPVVKAVIPRKMKANKSNKNNKALANILKTFALE